jgi:hypothetical protein
LYEIDPLVATLPKNSYSSKKKVATLSLKISVHLILRISGGFRMSQKNKRSILTSCAVWYPERTKVATS